MKLRQRRVQSDEDGLWIQCCNTNCKKWRFVKDFNDPLSVPETWICFQNPDKKFSSCDIPEEEIEEVLVESKYCSGSIVWAKLTGFPWWPAIVDHCPESQTFYQLSGSQVPVKYHVTFFEEKEVNRAWVKPENIKPFKEDDGNQPLKRAKKINSDIDYSESLEKSLEIARSALALKIDERLRKYSFSARFEEWEADLQISKKIDKDSSKIDKISSKTDKISLKIDKISPKKDKISSNIDKKTQLNIRRKIIMGRVKYTTANIDSQRNAKTVKNSVCSTSEQEKPLVSSPENKITLHTSVFEFNPISIINPQQWNICCIQ